MLLPVEPDELLILEVHAERYLVSRGLIGYRHGDTILLPLGELAAVLEYAIHADPERGIVEGWLGEENHIFRLDVAARSVTLGDQQQGLTEPCLFIDEDDIYLASDWLSRWWPIDLDIDLKVLRVVVRAREPLPLIVRLQRETTWDRHLNQDRSTVEYPRTRASYRLASWPFLDATVAYGADRRQEVWSGSLLSRGDLARLSVTSFASYNQRAADPWTTWLRAGRTDRDGKLLGPLGATIFEIGDVTGDALALIGRSGRGRGVAISNRPLGSLSQFDAIDVHGDAPPGWDVELYLNGSLYEIQVAGDDGRYLFVGVPLRLGLNTVRTVQYGRSGQVREQVRTYNIRSGMWRRGQLYYNYSSLQRGESILGAAAEATAEYERGEWSHQLDLGYGLSSLTTAGLAAARFHDGERTRDFLQARLLQSVGGVFLQSVLAKDLDGGQAGSISAQANHGQQSIFLGYSQFDDFALRTTTGRGQLRRRLESRTTGAFRTESGRQWNYRLSWQGLEFTDEQDGLRHAANLHLGTIVRRMSLGHDLGYYTRTSEAERDALLGRWLLAGQLLGMRVRGEVDYDLSGHDGVRGLGAGLNYVFRPELTGQLTGRRSFIGDGMTSAHGSLDWHLHWIRFGLRLGYSDPGGASVGLAATTSLAMAPRGGMQLTSQRLTQHGAATVLAFIDHDGDSVFGPGDEPLPGIGFRRHQLWQNIRTDGEGNAFLPGIQANQFINVLVDQTTIDDPFLVPRHEGMTTVVHPGGVASLQYPFQYVGEIEGLVLQGGPGRRSLRNIGLELLDADGRRVGEAVSEFDGYYLFQNVLPGEYLLRVVESTLRGRPFEVPEPRVVVVPPGGDHVQGPTFVLEDGRPARTMVAVAPASQQPAPPAQLEQASIPDTTPIPTPTSMPSQAVPAQPVDTEPTVAQVAPQPSSATPSAPAPTSVSAAGTMPPSQDRPIPAVKPISPTVPAAPPELSPQTMRTLHLLYELLHDSQLFARD